MNQKYHNPPPCTSIWSIRHRDSARTCILTDSPTCAIIARAIRGGHNVLRIDSAGGPFGPYGDEDFAADLADALTHYEAVLIAVMDPNVQWAISDCSSKRGLRTAVLKNLEILPRALRAGMSFRVMAALAEPLSIDFPGYELYREAQRAA